MGKTHTTADDEISGHEWSSGSEPDWETPASQTGSQDGSDRECGLEGQQPNESFATEEQFSGWVKWLQKGARRHIRATARTVSEAMYGEAKKKERPVKTKVRNEGPVSKRRPGPWRVVEIFTWTCVISMVASGRGWDVLEPITLPRWDVRNQSDREATDRYSEEVDLDLLAVQTPCLQLTVLQLTSQRAPTQIRKMRWKRAEARSCLGWVGEKLDWQRSAAG